MSEAPAGEIAAAMLPMRATLRQLQDETSWLVLGALYGLGLVLIQVVAQTREPSAAVTPCLALYTLLAAAWWLRKVSYLAWAWALVAACLAVSLLLVVTSGLGAAVVLLSLATGVAALLIGICAGALTAAACTLLLLWAPGSSLPLAPELRGFALIGAWSTVGLIWLTLRPLLTTMQWSWSSCEQSRKLLEQARDRQVQLKQALEDLANANLQLTRLNRLAQGLRRAAEDAQRAEEQFVANVSHELRTPLNMIIGFIEMIVETPETYGDIPAALMSDLNVVLRNSQHLSSLIDDVLDLSQVEAGQMAMSKEQVALSEIIAAAVTAVRPLFDSKGLFLRTEVAEDLPPILCDRTRVREVVLNLLSNAGRFTEQGGVHVRAWREVEEVVVRVSDTGPGISAEDSAKIFHPFQQLHGSTRRLHGGTGLGLSISKSFVELHGGRMWFESREGEGSSFYFSLPISPAVPVDAPASRWLNPEWEYVEGRVRPVATPVVVRPRFVVVEAGDSLRRLLARYLGGSELVPVSSMEEAIQTLARVPSRAVLINEESVPEALARVTVAGGMPHGTPAVICSLRGMHEAAEALGAREYLLKPVARHKLLETLDGLELRGKRVLIVDDEPEQVQLLWRMLASADRNYTVLTATDGQEALAILREQQPDAMLLDLIMPNMDGLQLLAARNEDPLLSTIPVVVLSAQDPAGQPTGVKAMAVARGGGLTIPQFLACIEALTRILATAGQADDPAPQAAPSC